MVVIFNVQNSHLLTLSLLTERFEVFIFIIICDALIFLKFVPETESEPPLILCPYCYPQSWTKPYPSLPANKLSVFLGVRKIKKLFTTMTWKNITREDDSQNSQLGSYECHAFAVDNSVKAKRHGFSVSVITGKSVYISWGVSLPYSLTLKISACV